MTVFISWSGERSKAIAHVFKKHLEYVIQGLPTFMSDKDIASGTQWFQEINDKLRDASFGIVCATPENLDKPWLSFEAGALGNQALRSRVVPVVFGMSKDDLPSPLNGFNAVDLDEEGFVKLIQSIHEAREVSTSWPIIEAAAHREWPDIASELAALPEPATGAEPAPSFNLEGSIKEIRGLLRDLVDRDSPQPINGREYLRLENNLRERLHGSTANSWIAAAEVNRMPKGLFARINALLHAYEQGDETAHADLIRLGFDPENSSPALEAVLRHRADARRGVSSEGPPTDPA